ncbi:MAG: aminoacyl-tRNA hydrolase [Propionibacteriaceae bacterium]|jgi:PTH1 family peptidyl-tRNA hydrolase|nr:aminoacyl-tRNA hydrolase [Propionibacteriaceae bacterium]
MATWLVVGLGNPGPAYAGHRHNIGAMAAAELARRGRGVRKSQRLLKADTADIKVGEAGAGAVGGDLDRVVLARTRTYMNESGVPVRALLGHLKLRPDHLIVIHDELDLDFDRLKVKYGGGDNGHNGLKSIRAMARTGEYYRVRAGIGRPAGPIDVSDWVLSNFNRSEVSSLPGLVGRAADATESLIRQGLDATQQRYNS